MGGGRLGKNSIEPLKVQQKTAQIKMYGV